MEHLTLTRIYLVQHRFVDAEKLLERLLSVAEAQGRIGSVIEILLLQALTKQSQGNATQALLKLERALSLAEPEGYIRLFVDEGAPMAYLLSKLHERQQKDQLSSANHGSPSLSYIEMLLTALHVKVQELRIGSRSQTLEERLSDRELEVLQLIIAGYSNRDIADKLVIALSTVKWYVNNIYGKLGVDSRTKAIARARELDLVEYHH
jgi:LuxR family maltose regulon positive regulatory protein